MSNFPFPPPPPPRFQLSSRDWLILAIVVAVVIMLGVFLIAVA